MIYKFCDMWLWSCVVYDLIYDFEPKIKWHVTVTCLIWIIGYCIYKIAQAWPFWFFSFFYNLVNFKIIFLMFLVMKFSRMIVSCLIWVIGHNIYQISQTCPFWFFNFFYKLVNFKIIFLISHSHKCTTKINI